MRLPRQQKMIDSGECVAVETVPGRTVRGSTYYQKVELIVSKEFAEFLISEGDVTRSEKQ